LQDDFKDESKPAAEAAANGEGQPQEGGINQADDLQALLSRAALNGSTYKAFSSVSRVSKLAPSEVPAVPRRAKAQEARPAEKPAQPPSKQTSAPPVTPRRDKPGTMAQTPPAPRVHTETTRRGGSSNDRSRWSALTSVLPEAARKREEDVVEILAREISSSALFVSSLSGGVGRTTIVATLARCLANYGERVLLAETAPSPLLPFSFGAKNADREKSHAFLMPDSNSGVEIFGSARDSGSTSEATREFFGAENFVAALCESAASSNRLILDAGEACCEHILALRSASHFSLIPLVPDLNSVLGLMNLESELLPHRESASPVNGPYYVLNKFDASLALHRNIRSSIEQLLGDRLLPFTIRRSDAVPEALADGMTVIDYCPEADIVEDFVRLADWVREMASARSLERNP
jgi:cellulose synthase operon protein YhjQ